MIARYLLIAAVLTGGFLAGCGMFPSAVPTTSAKYDKLPSTDRDRLPAETIVSVNLQRVLNQDLKPEARLESLRLVTRVGASVPSVQVRLAEMLKAPGINDELRQEAMRFLLARDHPELAPYIVGMLKTAEPGSDAHDALMGWLVRHPQADVLAEVVKLWAAEPETAGPNEPRYRQIVEQITDKLWDEALLTALNSPGFFARGSALEILSKRVPLTLIRMWVVGVPAETDAFAAMKAFLNKLNYLPTTKPELLNTVWLYFRRPEGLNPAAGLARQWDKQMGYRFNVSDFHLLSQLAELSQEMDHQRDALAAELGRQVEVAGHVRHQTSDSTGDYRSQLTDRLSMLSIADLWNLHLLSEMLGRDQIKSALKIAAKRDQADKTAAWGGLVFLKKGLAEATLYPAGDAGEDELEDADLIYRPGRRMLTESRDSLVRFICHFEKTKNALRAGPTKEELASAAGMNYYGLVLTSLSDTEFCAHYYNPGGTVFSLGTFVFN